MNKISKVFSAGNSPKIHEQGLLATAMQLLKLGLTVDEYKTLVSIANETCNDPDVNNILVDYTTVTGTVQPITPKSVVKFLLLHEPMEVVVPSGGKLITRIYVKKQGKIYLPHFNVGGTIVESTSRGFYERMTESDWGDLKDFIPETSHISKR